MGRVKDRNIRRDPRAGILTVDLYDSYRYLAIGGTVVEIKEEDAVDHVEALARLYTDYEGFYGFFKASEQPQKEVRDTFKILSTHVTFSSER